MSAPGAEPVATAARPGAAGEIVLVVDGVRGPAASLASALRRSLSGSIGGRAVTVLVATTHAEAPLVDPEDPRAAGPAAAPTAEADAAQRAALGALLREADRRSAVVARVSPGVRDPDGAWARALLSPVLDEGYELVSPAYRRGRLEGMLNTAVLYPLTRALYGLRLRQVTGGEGALAPPLVRRLLEDPDWRRDPQHAGSDAWLVAKVLAGHARIGQAWLGAWPGDPRVPEDPSHALARLVGAAFVEMERHAARWQRIEGSQPVPASGEPGPAPADDAARSDATELVKRFRLGLRELEPLWGRVLPPASLLALRRAGASAPEALRVDDTLWARVVYDFAVAHYVRAVERQQLLRSMTPLYMGWVAGFVNDVRALDAAATEARVEALCLAFEREKRYAIARWRWPDEFNP